MGCKGSKSVQVEDIPQPVRQATPPPPPPPRSPTPPPSPEVHDEETSEPVKPPAHPRKKRPKRDFGIKFYDSSKGRNGTAKYTYEIKGRTSRVYKAEPADIRTVKKHCQHKRREPAKGEQEDLRLIQEVHVQNSIVSELEQQDQELESVILDDDRKPECDCDCCLEEQEEKEQKRRDSQVVNNPVSVDVKSESGTPRTRRGTEHSNGTKPAANGHNHHHTGHSHSHTSLRSSTGHAHASYPPAGHPSTGHPPTGHPPSGHPSTGHPPTGHPPTGHPPTGHSYDSHRRTSQPGSHGNSRRVTSGGYPHVSRTSAATRRSRESFASNRSTRSTDSVCSDQSAERIFLKLDTAPGEYDYHQYRILVIKDRQDSTGSQSPPQKPKRPKSKLLDRYGIKSPYSSGKPVVSTFRPRATSASGQSREKSPQRNYRPVTAAYVHVRHPPGTPAPPGSPDLDHMRAQYLDPETKSNGSAI